MDETIHVIFKVQFGFALEVWFSISSNVLKNAIKLCGQVMLSKVYLGI